MKPILSILTGDRAGDKIELEHQRVYLIGRDAAADIVIPENKASRRHAHLIWNEKTKMLSIEDLRSLNGTIVNGNPLDTTCLLQNKDRFQIGSVLFEVSFDEAELVEIAGVPLPQSDELVDLEFLDEAVADAGPETPPDPRYQTDGTSIVGNLREISFPDLLQMLSVSNRSGKLVIAPHRKDLTAQAGADCAVIWLKNGDLIGAHFKKMKGEDAIFEILRWKTGYFALYYREPISTDTNLDLPLEALLIEGLRRIDEEKTMTVQFKAEDELDVNPDAPLNLLEPDQLRIFQIVWKKHKVALIWEHSHLDKDQTDNVLKVLLRQNYIHRKIS